MEKDKDIFYEQLEIKYTLLPKHEFISICNAKIDREDVYRNTVKKHSKIRRIK